MNREQTARKKHAGGYSCSSAVYAAFSDLVTGSAPFPKSEGGKCGAVLAAEKVLNQLGLDREAFDRQFAARFGSLKCAELRRSRIPCNDLVGAAAAIAAEAVGR